MKKLLATVSLVLLVLMLSCETATDCCVPPPNEEQSGLLGPWLLYERGYSPGAGYFTVDIPAKPAQTVTLNVNYTVVSTYDAFMDYNHYRLFADPMDTERQVIAFYKESPGTDAELDNADASYSIELTENTLKLYFRWCIEGCHLAFKRPE